MPSHIQQTGAFNSTAVSALATANFPVATTAGDTISCYVSYNSGTVTVTSVTDTLGNTFNAQNTITTGPVSGSSFSLQNWTAFNIAAGTDAITFHFSAVVPTVRIHCQQIRGVSAKDQSSSSTGTGTAITSGNVITTAAAEFLHGYGLDNTGLPTVETGWTAGITENSELDEWFISSTTGTFAATYTGDTGTWICQLVTFSSAVPITSISSSSSIRASQNFEQIG